MSDLSALGRRLRRRILSVTPHERARRLYAQADSERCSLYREARNEQLSLRFDVMNGVSNEFIQLHQTNAEFRAVADPIYRAASPRLGVDPNQPVHDVFFKEDISFFVTDLLLALVEEQEPLPPEYRDILKSRFITR